MTFYVFNIAYPTKCISTLIFLQKYVCNLQHGVQREPTALCMRMATLAKCRPMYVGKCTTKYKMSDGMCAGLYLMQKKGKIECIIKCIRVLVSGSTCTNFSSPIVPRDIHWTGIIILVPNVGIPLLRIFC